MQPAADPKYPSINLMVKEKKKVVKSEDKPSGPGTEQMMVTTSGRGLRDRRQKI